MSNSKTILSDLAHRINEHDKSQHACRVKAIMHALRIGELLTEAKKVLSHGKFLKWVEANTTVGPRQAQKYMTIAESDEVRQWAERNYELSSHLTIAKAVKLARREKTKKQWAASINDSYVQSQKCLKDAAGGFAKVRSGFKGNDAAFIAWTINADMPADLAHKLPDLLNGEYDEDAWFDALLTDENLEWLARAEAAAP